jgi:outer membrane protein
MLNFLSLKSGPNQLNRHSKEERTAHLRLSFRSQSHFARSVAVLLLTLPNISYCQAAQPHSPITEPIPLTLREAVQRAIEASPEAVAEKIVIQRADALLQAAKGVFDPVIRLGGDLRRESRPSSSVLEAPNGRVDEHLANGSVGVGNKLPWNGVSFDAMFENTRQSSTNPFFALNPYYSPRVRFALNVPLLRGLRTDADRTEIKVRSLESRLSRWDLQWKLTDRAARVMATYWQLRAAVNARKAAQLTRDAAADSLSSTERLVREGEQPQAELYGARGQLQRAEESLAEATGMELQAQNTLRLLLASSEQDAILSSTIQPVDEEAPSESRNFDELVSFALASRPDLKNSSGQVEVQQARVRLAANEALPKFDLQLSYLGQGLSGRPQVSNVAAIPGFDLRPPPNLIGSTWTGLDQIRRNQFPAYAASLRIELPLRNQGAEGRLHEARLAQQQLQLQQKQLKIQIALEVRQALDAISATQRRVRAAEQSETASQERLASELRLYREGQSNNLSLNVRQNELAQSRQLVVRAHQAHNLAKAELLRVTGQVLSTFGIQIEEPK